MARRRVDVVLVVRAAIDSAGQPLVSKLSAKIILFNHNHMLKKVSPPRQP